MKKCLFFVISTLALTSCDFINLVPSKKESDGHHGISLLLNCNDGLNITTHKDQIFMDNLDMTSMSVGSTTIKRLDGKITFYDHPIYGTAQLQELPKNPEPLKYCFEEEIDFAHSSGSEIDFVYFTGISWSAEDEENIVYKNLRLAIFDKETSSDYFVLSYDPNGLTSKTEYNLDVDGDGELDRNQSYAWESNNNELINYTTGMPYYMTDNYEICIPTEQDIANDRIDPLMSCMKVNENKPLTLRVWVEGWEVDNNNFKGTKIDIKLDFAPHFAK